MTNGVIRGVGDSISDNNKVWDGTPKETTIKLEIRCLKSRSSFLLSNFRWICLSFLIGMRLTFPDCKKIKANNPETMDTKRKPRVRRYIETTYLELLTKVKEGLSSFALTFESPKRNHHIRISCHPLILAFSNYNACSCWNVIALNRLHAGQSNRTVKSADLYNLWNKDKSCRLNKYPKFVWVF